MHFPPEWYFRRVKNRPQTLRNRYLQAYLPQLDCLLLGVATKDSFCRLVKENQLRRKPGAQPLFLLPSLVQVAF